MTVQTMALVQGTRSQIQTVEEVLVREGEAPNNAHNRQIGKSIFHLHGNFNLAF